MYVANFFLTMSFEDAYRRSIAITSVKTMSFMVLGLRGIVSSLLGLATQPDEDGIMELRPFSPALIEASTIADTIDKLKMKVAEEFCAEVYEVKSDLGVVGDTPEFLRQAMECFESVFARLLQDTTVFSDLHSFLVEAHKGLDEGSTELPDASIPFLKRIVSESLYLEILSDLMSLNTSRDISGILEQIKEQREMQVEYFGRHTVSPAVRQEVYRDVLSSFQGLLAEDLKTCKPSLEGRSKKEWLTWTIVEDEASLLAKAEEIAAMPSKAKRYCDANGSYLVSLVECSETLGRKTSSNQELAIEASLSRGPSDTKYSCANDDAMSFSVPTGFKLSFN